MSRPSIWRTPGVALLIAEGRQLLRDPRTVFAAIVLPVLFVPALFLIQSWSLQQADRRTEERVARYAVVGAEAALARELLAVGATRLEEREEKADQAADATSPGPGDALPRLEEAPVEEVASLEDARSALEEGALDAVLEALPAGTSAADASAADASAADASTADASTDLPLLRIVFRGDEDASRAASRALETRLEAGRALRRVAALERVGLDLPIDELFAVGARHDLATAAERSGAVYGRGAVLVMLFFMLLGGAVVAADTLAGEKERGTLETLLTTAIDRRQLVLAKAGLVTLVGVFIALVQVLNLWLYVGLRWIDLGDDFALELSPAAAVWLVVLLLPLAVFAAAVLLRVSGGSDGYKDFQLRFFPVFLLLLAPAGAAFLPGLPLRSAVALVPVANVAVGVRDLLAGRFDPLALGVVALVSYAVAAATLRAGVGALGGERLIAGSSAERAEHVGGAALFPRHVLRWFAGLWALVFLATAIEPLATFRGQILFNLLGVFLGGSLLMLRLYRLDVRRVLSWRPPPASVWLAVLLGAPATLLTVGVLGRLNSRLVPVPDRMIEAFSRSLIPEDMATWQLVLAIALVPAIAEEIAFRGVLLHGLRQRYGPVAACFVSAGIFALFHLALFRLLPTLLLGLLFAAVTLWTRSLWPAMLWHASNNGLLVVLARREIDVQALDAWIYAVAVPVAAACLLWIWRRRVHPRPRAPGQGPVRAIRG